MYAILIIFDQEGRCGFVAEEDKYMLDLDYNCALQFKANEVAEALEYFSEYFDSEAIAVAPQEE